MTSYTALKLNDHFHGKLNRGTRGYFPTPKSSKQRAEERRKSREELLAVFKKF